LSIRSVLPQWLQGQRAPTLERAEQAYGKGSLSDAAAAFRTLAQQGNREAQWRLAQLYERGEGVLQNFVEAVRWLRSAAEQGCLPAMARLGEIYLTGLAAPDTATPAALSRLEQSSEQHSLFKRLYPEGLAVAQDLALAAQWNSSAAQAGDAAAQARLGHQCACGLGVARDFKQAEHWFAAAAAQAHAAGELGLGMLYAGGYGESREHARALEWLEPCAARGNATAQLCLARRRPRRGCAALLRAGT